MHGLIYPRAIRTFDLLPGLSNSSSGQRAKLSDASATMTCVVSEDDGLYVWGMGTCIYPQGAKLIGHFQPCTTDIYVHIDARMADYIATHPYTFSQQFLPLRGCWFRS